MPDSQPLPLPAPSSDATPQLPLGGSTQLDALGPLVVNSDGTLSRIANWESMTQPERERTVRVLAARNKIRLAEQEAKQAQEEGAEGAPS